jgi:NAD(P)-dependent dehydrogenase (short-subunit alcohol dehydrogenase family)
MDLMRLADRVALITGAGSGIGRASAIKLSDAGAKIAGFDIDQEEINSLVQDIQDKGGQGLGIVGDVSDPEAMRNAVSQVIDRWSRLDIVFANAGINGLWAPIEEIEPQDWDKTIDTNLKGTYLTVKYAVPHLKKNGGSVIITSSVNGTRKFSNSGATAYASSKAAQVAFAKMIALELANDKIRVNVICPGWIQTNIEENTEKKDIETIREPVKYPEGTIPLTDGKPGSPEQVAQLVLFLASDASDLITGTEIWIDGGESLLQG